jgi:hypothetical protein
MGDVDRLEKPGANPAVEPSISPKPPFLSLLGFLFSSTFQGTPVGTVHFPNRKRISVVILGHPN